MSLPTRRTTALRRGLAAIGAVGAFALLAACSSGPTETTAPEETVAVDPFAPEVTDVKLAGIKAPGLIPLHIAATETSAEYGLTIEPVWIDNSGIAITSVISGEVAAANASYFGAIDAINQGLEIVLIAEGWASTPGTGPLEALPSSGIETLADLEGKTVNVISLNSSHAIKLRDVMLSEGLDPEAVNWVELPYGEVAAALEQGTIDASSAVGPTLGAVKGMGSVTVFDYGAEPFTGMAESGWWASKAFVDANPNTVAAIQCSIFGAQGALVADRALYDTAFQELLGAPEAVAKADIMLDFQTSNRLDQIQRNADLYLAADRITEEFDFSLHVLDAPDNC